MCGIVGFTGKREAAGVLLAGLKALEYRGYDSAGIAVMGEAGLELAKTSGRIETLCELTRNGASLPGRSGIGHTRWATHGAPTDLNAHPHVSNNGKFAVVHNGIIENYSALREELTARGCVFLSETDTEVVVHLLETCYTGDIKQALMRTAARLEGSYALGILCTDAPGKLYALREASPLILGLGAGENYFASDVTALVAHTRNAVFLEDGQFAELTAEGVTVFDGAGRPIDAPVTRIEWSVEAAEKGGYEHFMLKEMHEQPKAVKDTLTPRIKNGDVVIEELGMTDEEIRAIRKIFIVACGSAYHTGVTAKYVFEKLARIPVEVDLASEFRYRDPILPENTLVVIVSQSGETADTLAALRLAKEKGVRTLGIVNVVGSSIAREADNVMYTWAGPEIAVATTKAYSTQLIAQYLLAMKFAKVRGTVSQNDFDAMIQSLERLPEQISLLLSHKENVQRFANRYLAAEHVFFIGRGIDYAISMEGSLKLKEISYIHSEAYAAGELKHGTISLIEDGRLVVAVLTQPELYKKMISNIQEVKTRGAFVMAVTTVGNTEVEKVADYVVYLPETNPIFANSLAIIPLQLFGYYVSIGRGLDVDKPRNLAKSVTVE